MLKLDWFSIVLLKCITAAAAASAGRSMQAQMVLNNLFRQTIARQRQRYLKCHCSFVEFK